MHSIVPATYKRRGIEQYLSQKIPTLASALR